MHGVASLTGKIPVAAAGWWMVCVCAMGVAHTDVDHVLIVAGGVRMIRARADAVDDCMRVVVRSRSAVASDLRMRDTQQRVTAT